MTGQFLGKVVVIIGGSSGIGLASAIAFANEGAQVVIAGRNTETLRAAALQVGHEVLVLSCDVTIVAQITELFSVVRKRFGNLDILFVNAGVLALMPIEAVTESDWDWVVDTNLKGAFFCVQAALPLMRKGSAIVLNSSTAAHRGVATGVVYAASKSALGGLGRSLAAELIARGIRVNIVSPGPTDTAIFGRVRGRSAGTEAALRQGQIENVPMMRMGTPAEVAAAVMFLAGDSASFVTGVDLLIDGGVTHL